MDDEGFSAIKGMMVAFAATAVISAFIWWLCFTWDFWKFFFALLILN